MSRYRFHYCSRLYVNAYVNAYVLDLNAYQPALSVAPRLPVVGQIRALLWIVPPEVPLT